ncbi:hypothetical protein EHQ94_04630 [Leptospira meyeri]|uniref:hypothetical protein n=1 Tax=Leptospira meyeri TaxID=29508 RepID=UPI001083CF09|nr:hypothetical protein [Leptospira meyeri]TGM62405.1 hypothetical protein EHQ93_13965 [Leptospira meyeri]TGM71290.1 hypothetical protein EHQ94_04630 [Leptospira meyeri]
MNKYLIKFIFAFATILGVSCASFKANKLPLVQESDFKSTKTEKIKVFSRWKYETTGADGAAWAAAHKSWFDKSILDSGCCELVEGPKEATLVVDGTAIDHNSPWLIIPIIINGASLTVIPFWQSITVDIKVSATKGNKTSTYALKDSFTYVSWLPMIFVYPFTGGATKNKEELFYNTYLNLVVQLKRDGHL